jgi:serine/threonine protein phosphatase PrpC
LQEKSLDVFFDSRVFKNGRIRNRSIVSNERIDDIFHEWDRSLLNIDIGHSGATGNIVLVDEDSIKIAYVGDSRSLIYIPGKKDAIEKQNKEDNILVSADHKVTDLKERERVKRKGGTIAVNSNFLIANKDIMLDEKQPEKVTLKKQYQDFIDEGDKKQVISSDGSFHAHIVLRVSIPSHETALAMSRSFGDLRLKRDLTAETNDPKYKYDGEGILSCKPTIGEIKIPNEENMDIYIVVASDGFWDYVLDNQEIITIIQREKTLPKIRDALKKKVVNQHDDTTILVVHLKTKKQK